MDSLDGDEYAAARFESQATGDTGPYRNDYCCLARCDNDLLIEGWEYVDRLGALLRRAPGQGGDSSTGV